MALSIAWFILIPHILQSALGNEICNRNKVIGIEKEKIDSFKARCLPICSEDLASQYNLSVPDEQLVLNVSTGETQKEVNLYEFFHTLGKITCDAPHTTHPIASEEFRVYVNGNILLPDFFNMSYTHFTTEEEEFHICIAANGTSAAAIICSYNKGPSHQSRMYSVFLATSVVFLTFTLIAFFAAPEMQNLQGKSIAAQSAYLLVAYFASIFSHLQLASDDKTFCKILVYVTHASLLGSFFWLHTMCFDIFWTFSDFAKMSGSLNQTHRKKFRIYAAYATISPATLSLLLIILDNCLDTESILNPNIYTQDNVCWFEKRSTEFLYLQGPIVLILVQNLVFFLVAFYKINKMKSESKVLKRGDSMTHSGESTDTSNRKRLVMYVKLFLLMGGTWVLEVLSWAVEGNDWVWLVPDIINSSRGVLIFYICVWSNSKVRRSLLKRIGFSTAQNSSSVKSRSSTSKVSDATKSQHDSAAIALQQTKQEEEVSLNQDVEQHEHRV